jgi:hypothetical protein
MPKLGQVGLVCTPEFLFREGNWELKIKNYNLHQNEL